ncbi:hypothetical protein BC628DRAFT_1049683 [Trametes gibbosa]|nr:hypothetical protein BC628DRAFT_1049683 [Trametes gibbosa]
MVVDIGITVVLCWYMWSEKVYVRRRTHQMLDRIIIFSVNRGAIAAVLQVLTLLTPAARSSHYGIADLWRIIALRDMMQSDMEGTEQERNSACQLSDATP